MPLLYPQLQERLSIRGARFARRAFGWTGIARRTLQVFGRFCSNLQAPGLEEAAAVADDG